MPKYVTHGSNVHIRSNCPAQTARPAGAVRVRVPYLLITIITWTLYLSPTVLIAQTTDRPVRLEAESGTLLGGADRVLDPEASGGKALDHLDHNGSGVAFQQLPAGDKLAVHYASTQYGTFSLYLNGSFVKKINLHSSGADVGSYLNAVIPIPIPARATLTLQHDAGDAAWNVDYILVGTGDLGLPPDIWNLPPLPIHEGPYHPDWQQLSRTYRVPDWFREAKFGVWSHWDPQSFPEQGDWYARRMYIPTDSAYQSHLKLFGHPSEEGYKDICHLWNVDKWDPEALMQLYVDMGAKYFVAMGNHHDNFDNWDSKYQPWNSVNIGPHKDIVGTWEKAARSHGIRFGIGFHASPPRTWGQFMPVRYKSDQTGPMKGIPYDGLMTILNGKGKWWQGYDPVDLYGPPHKSTDPSLTSPFANQFMWRVDDAINKYHPDLIYFDEHAGNSLKDLGVSMGLDFLAPQLVANYYNSSLAWNKGVMDVVINLKGIGGKYNSFGHNPEMVPVVEASVVKSTEAVIEKDISPYPFQTETSIAAWHYQAGQRYMSASDAVRRLIENVCRNGTLLLNITQHGDGHLDDPEVQMCKQVGAWLKVNGESIYGSRPFEVLGEGDIRYTRANGFVYALILNWPVSNQLNLTDLKKGCATIGAITGMTLLGSSIPLTFIQDENGLSIKTAEAPPKSLAHVIKITQDKPWINDDDPGVIYSGWTHVCNLGNGDFNNDLHVSTLAGDFCELDFQGSGINVLASRGPGYGTMEVFIDGASKGRIDLRSVSDIRHQQTIYATSNLPAAKHHFRLVHLDSNPVSVDAFCPKP